MAVINGTPGNDDVPPLDGTTDPDTIDGLAGNDIINGFAGNDTIFGGEGNDIINGDDGDDILHGGAGVFVDKMFGGNGNDLFIKDGLTDNFGGTQLDAFLGDAGTDTLELRAVAAPVLSPFGNLSQHQLFGGFGTQFFTNFESIERLVFASQAGQTVGALLHEGTLGDAGVTEMVGGAGRDFASFLTNFSGTFTMPVLTYTNWTPVSANAWTQTGDFIALVSVVGTATLNAAAGLNVNQALVGGSGNDILNGSANADILNGSAGTNQLFGNGGNDALLIVNNAALILPGVLGSQTTLTGAGSTFDGGAGTDVLSVGGFVDFQGTLAGIEGIDLLPAFMPTDPSQRGQFVATLDLDTVQYSALPGNAFFRGTGAVIFNITSGSIFSGSTYTFEVGSAVEVAVIGTGNADTITGTSANDTLDGKGGNDQLFGLLGDDQYQVDSQADLTFEAIGAGIDTVVASSNHYLFANVENLILHGSAGNIFGVGNELANVLTGNAGENLLIAGASDDTVNGGDARDAIFGEGGADVLKGEGGIDYIVAGAGNDTVDGGLQADEIYGEDGDDTLYGGSGLFTDIIVAGAGNDTISGSDSFGGNDGDFDFLYGNLGNDTFFVNTPADLVFENPGEGTDTVVANIIGAGFYMYENLENLILDGQTPFGVGNGLANELTGNAIGNYLLGGAGNDTLNGKQGGDVLFGEAGSDTFVFETGTGGDVIGDFAAGSDKIQINGIFANFAAAQANFIQNGNVGAINLGNGDFIVLHNVTMSQLTATDFMFG